MYNTQQSPVRRRNAEGNAAEVIKLITKVLCLHQIDYDYVSAG